MAISTQLIGRLGGRVETQTVSISDYYGSASIPAGWRKAAGIFTGTATRNVATVFDGKIAPAGDRPNVNGGGCSQPAKPRRSTTPAARSRGTGWNDPWGGGVGGSVHTDHRDSRRGRGQNLRCEQIRYVSGGGGEDLPRNHTRKQLFVVPDPVWPSKNHQQRHTHRYRAGGLAPRVVV